MFGTKSRPAQPPAPRPRGGNALSWWSENTRARITFPFLCAVGVTIIAWQKQQSLGSWSGVLFVLGVILFSYLPGRLALRLFGWNAENAPWSLTLCAGVPTGLALYAVIGRWLPPPGFTGLAAFALLALIWNRRRRFRMEITLPQAPIILGIVAACSLALWGLSATTYRSAQKTADSELSYVHNVVYQDLKTGGSDAMFHAALAGVLARSLSLDLNPFVSGAPIAYHYGMDSQAAIFSRELGIHPLDLMSRLLPTFSLLLLCALVYHLGRALSFSPASSVLGTLLIFGTDFRILLYLFPIHPNWTDKYWLPIFTSYPSTSFFWVNPELPALVLFAGGLFALATSSHRFGGRLLAGLLLGLTAFFKVFMAVHLGAALAAAAAVRFLRTRRCDLIEVTLIAGMVMLGFAVDNRFYAPANVEIEFGYLAPVAGAFRAAGLVPLVKILNEARAHPHLGSLFLASISLAFYLVMVLGVRTAALPHCFRLIAGPETDLARGVLSHFFILGLLPPLFLIFGYSGLNNSFWFTSQSLFAGSILLADRIGAIVRPHRRHLTMTAALLLSILPTVRAIAFAQTLPAERWSRAELESALHLRDTAAPADVVLHRVFPDTPSPASHLGGLPSVLTYWQGYPTNYTNWAEVNRRLGDLATFFRTEEAPVARSLLEQYGVTWVYSVKARSPLRFPTHGILEKEFENEDVVLYRVK